MKNLIFTTLKWSCVALFLSSCSPQSHVGSGAKLHAPIEPLACIAVLPATTSVGHDETIQLDEARDLERGATFATSVISKELMANENVKMLTTSQISSLVSEVSGGYSGTIAALGEKLNCDGVLTTIVSKFKQRKGSEYSSESTASTKFSMTLRHAEKGSILWSADFGETQESFLSNILSFEKVQSRGFRWITVEELLESGIHERLRDCPYLN